MGIQENERADTAAKYTMTQDNLTLNFLHWIKNLVWCMAINRDNIV